MGKLELNSLATELEGLPEEERAAALAKLDLPLNDSLQLLEIIAGNAGSELFKLESDIGDHETQLQKLLDEDRGDNNGKRGK